MIGYGKVIIKALVSGKRKELPSFGKFWTNFKEGVVIFIFFIPTFMVLILIGLIPIAGNAVATLFNIFLLPWLIINFLVKGTFDSLWEIKKSFNLVFDNVVEYLFAYLKTLVYALIYAILSIVLVGIPCYIFGGSYFLTDFYRNHNK